MQKLYVDIETNGTVPGNGAELLLAGYALDDGPVDVLDLTRLGTDGPAKAHNLERWLEDPNIATVSHSTFDPRFFEDVGYTLAGPLIDTKVMAWVLNENTPLDIDWLAWRYAQVEMDKRLRRSAGLINFEADDGQLYDLAKWAEWRDTPAWQQFVAYNERDVEALRKLEGELADRLEESEWTKYWLTEEVPYTRVLVSMEHRGLPVDLPSTERLASRLEVMVANSGRELKVEAGLPDSFNLNSSHQLVAYLFSRVVTLDDTLRYDTATLDCLKSCAAGEHEDCEMDGFVDYPDGRPTYEYHVMDLLPAGFVVDKLGRDLVHGHWTVKGRGLAKTDPPFNKVTGEHGKLPSTSSPELLYMHASDPWVLKLCTEYRKQEKLLNTYLHKFPRIARRDSDGHTRIYGRYNQTGTVTGRLSSLDPNMQNMPARGALGKAVRGLFRFPEESPLWLVVADYDQLEMRIMAHLSQDRRLLKAFREGRDPHVMLANAIFGDIDAHDTAPGAATSYRDVAKTLNYAMGYGAGPRKVAQTLSLLGFPTEVPVARGYLAEMERYYHGLFGWKRNVIAYAKHTGNVATMGGRRRRLRAAFRDTANWKLVGYGERQAVNAIVQGTAGDIVRRAMIAFDREMPELPMLAQVHDELVFQAVAHDALEVLGLDDGRDSPFNKIRDIGEMAHGFSLHVPLVFTPHVGKSWAEAKAGEAGPDLELLREDEDE